MAYSRSVAGGMHQWRIPPASTAFNVLLAALAALPSFGIDMSLPALASIGSSLGVSPEKAGLTMSLFMVGFATAPVLFGPLSDRYGRRPAVLLALALFSLASVGCALSATLPGLLSWRIVQGAGAGIGMTLALAIIRDLFDGNAGRTKLSYIVVTMLVVPMIGPTAGTGLLLLGGWRSISGVLAGIGAVLFATCAAGLEESAAIHPARRLTLASVFRDYRQILGNPVCVGYMLINAAGFGALFAYVSGSSLYFVGTVGLTAAQYSMLFAGTSIGIMAGAFANGRLSAKGVPPTFPLVIGLALAFASAVALLGATLAGWTPLPGVIGLLLMGNVAFGFIAPNATQLAMQPLPTIAGSAGAAATCIQMLFGSASSALVVSAHDGHSVLSMALVMAACSSLAAVVYIGMIGLRGPRGGNRGIEASTPGSESPGVAVAALQWPPP